MMHVRGRECQCAQPIGWLYDRNGSAGSSLGSESNFCLPTPIVLPGEIDSDPNCRQRAEPVRAFQGLTFRYIMIYLIISSTNEDTENAISRKPSRALVWTAQARQAWPWSPSSPPPFRQELD